MSRFAALLPSPLSLTRAALIGALLLMLGERALLFGSHGPTYSALTLWLWLPLLLLCHWFPYVAVTGVVLHGVEKGVRALAGQPRPRRALGYVGLVLPAFGYACLLAWYTFDGPQARLAWYRPFGLLLLPVAFTLALGFPCAAFSDPKRAQRRSLYLPLLLFGMLGSLGLNARMLPDEYEPLHVFLALVALACAASFGCLIAGSGAPDARRRVGVATLVGASLVAFVCMLVTSRSHVLSFFVYGKAPGTRYLATKLDWESDSGVTGPTKIDFKPNLAADPKRAEKARQARALRALPNIIVFSIDNVQSNHVGAYGYAVHPTTPNIDRLAKRGMLFERAYSWFPRTRMFLSSMLLGRLLPRFKEHDFPESYRRVSLTRLLGQRGYHVLVKGWFDTSLRFAAQGYDVDTWMPPASEEAERKIRGQPHVPMSKNYRTLRRHFAAAKKRGKPVFAWMHFLRPHHVGSRFFGDPSHAFGDARSDQYDSALAVADSYLPELERLAKKYLEPERPLYWFVMSDHGAGFANVDGQKVFNEGRDIGESFVHVPLIVAGPDIPAGRSAVLVSAAIDTAASVLDLVGIAPPPSYDGVSYLPVLDGSFDRAAAESRAVYLNYYRWRGVVHGRHKLVSVKGGISLVDVVDDPNGWLNVADEQEALARQLAGLVRRESVRVEEQLEAHGASKTKQKSKQEVDDGS